MAFVSRKMPVKGSMMNKCSMEPEEPYALDAAGQKVYAGDHVLASLPNIPATRRPRTLHPCLVERVQADSFRLTYAGDDRRYLRWTREPFLRWRREVVKANLNDDADGRSQCSQCRHCIAIPDCDEA